MATTHSSITSNSTTNTTTQSEITVEEMQMGYHPAKNFGLHHFIEGLQMEPKKIEACYLGHPCMCVGFGKTTSVLDYGVKEREMRAQPL